MLRSNLALCILGLWSAGASAGPTTAPACVASATADQKAALLDRMKTLAGTWEMTDEKGQTVTAAVFSVSSAGSAVREVMFPGQPHEMTNMYHMDGPSLLVVHYCAVGNQPNMRATAQDARPDRIEFKLDHVTNMTAPTQVYMGGLTIVFKDADTILEEWTHFQNGQAGKPTVMEIHRKKN